MFRCVAIRLINSIASVPFSFFSFLFSSIPREKIIDERINVHVASDSDMRYQVLYNDKMIFVDVETNLSHSAEGRDELSRLAQSHELILHLVFPSSVTLIAYPVGRRVLVSFYFLFFKCFIFASAPAIRMAGTNASGADRLFVFATTADEA